MYTRLAEVYDEVVVPDGLHARWAAFLDELWAGDVRRVLDVCCGTGLLAAELVARGYEVAGVDGSAEMLARARSRLGADVLLEVSRLPALAVGGVFDAAVSTFESFDHLAPDDLAATFSALAPHLRPGGWLVFDLHTDEQLRFMAAHPVIDGDGYRLTSVVDGRTCEMTLELGEIRETHREHFHRPADVRAALETAGFDVAGVRDDYSERPAGESTQTATWITRRR
jgi:SAM-dependent methyltransferase